MKETKFRGFHEHDGSEIEWLSEQPKIIEVEFIRFKKVFGKDEYIKVKEKVKGFWVYGSVIDNKYIVNGTIEEDHLIIVEEWYLVIRETICQEIGNGIYVGDVVYEEDDNEELYIVTYDEEECGYYLAGYDENTSDIRRFEHWECLAVIGNIYDMKEKNHE